MDSDKLVVVYFDEEFAKNDDKESKLQSLFGDVNLTNGGEIEKLNLNRNNSKQAFIYFKEKEVAERVAKQKNIRIGEYKFNVKLNNRKSSNQQENKNRDPYEEFNTDEDNEKDSVEPKEKPQQKPTRYKDSSNNNNKKSSPRLNLNKRAIIIDGNNIGMRYITLLYYNKVSWVGYIISNIINLLVMESQRKNSLVGDY